MIWRRIDARDLMECLSVGPACIGEELVGHTRAIEAWKKLIQSRSFQSAVIETNPPIAGHRIVGFGASVFVSRDFVDQEISNPRPGLNARLIASVACGNPVVLGDTALRSANTRDGLDLVMPYALWRQAVLSPEEIFQVQSLLVSSFLDLHLGYRMHRWIAEIIGEMERKVRESTGVWKVISDFAEFYRLHPDIKPAGRSLAVVTEESAFAVPGSVGALLFERREPVLQLHDSDQELLTAALRDLTDEEVAHALNIQVSGVKKRWRSLFERVSAVRPDLLPDDGFDGVRGREKRRLILAYVREHPEELRPFDAGARTSGVQSTQGCKPIT
jgi:hypothetical protein